MKREDLFLVWSMLPCSMAHGSMPSSLLDVPHILFYGPGPWAEHAWPTRGCLPGEPGSELGLSLPDFQCNLAGGTMLDVLLNVDRHGSPPAQSEQLRQCGGWGKVTQLGVLVGGPNVGCPADKWENHHSSLCILLDGAPAPDAPVFVEVSVMGPQPSHFFVRDALSQRWFGHIPIQHPNAIDVPVSLLHDSQEVGACRRGHAFGGHRALTSWFNELHPRGVLMQVSNGSQMKRDLNCEDLTGHGGVSGLGDSGWLFSWL